MKYLSKLISSRHEAPLKLFHNSILSTFTNEVQKVQAVALLQEQLNGGACIK